MKIGERSGEARRWRAGDLLIDADTRQVHRAGVELALTRLSLDLLLALVRAAPRMLTFDELMDQVWPGVVVSPETLTQRVKLLRRSLGDEAEAPRYISAIRGVGYRLAIPTEAIAIRQAHASFDSGAAAGTTLEVDAQRFLHQAEAIVNGSVESFLAAITLYDEALKREPRSTRALSGRALNRAALAWSGSEHAHGLALAERDARTALQLDPGERRAVAVLGSIHAMRCEWIPARDHFEAALAADPQNAEIRAQYAISVLLPGGHRQAAAEKATEACRLDERSGFAAMMLAVVRDIQGLDGEAIAQARRGAERGAHPASVEALVAAVSLRSAAHPGAIGRVVASLPPGLRDAGAAPVMRQAWDARDDPAARTSAVAGLRQLLRQPAWLCTDAWNRRPVLQLYARLDALDELYDEYGRILSMRIEPSASIPAIAYIWSPEMTAFRSDRRFRSLAERLGLVEYWEKAGPPDTACFR